MINMYVNILLCIICIVILIFFRTSNNKIKHLIIVCLTALHIVLLNIATHTKTLRHGMDKCYFKIVYRPDQLNCLRYRNNCVQRCMYSFSLCWFLPLLFCYYYPRKTDLARSPFSSLFVILSYIISNIYFDTPCANVFHNYFM
jgi:formate hydrogenlyase subunit 3/multisubunit Na+/H+ antiporter MnhD subunit